MFDALETPTPPQAVLSAARLIATNGVARAAASRLGEPRPAPRGLLDAVTATADTQAGFVTIAARASKAKRAADVANAFATALVSLRARQAVRRLDAAIAGCRTPVAAAGCSRAQRRQLAERLSRLRALRDAPNGTIHIAEGAVAADSPVAPRIGRTVAMARIVALLLGLAAVGLAHGADRKVRDPLELPELLGGPLLSTVPREAMGGLRPSPTATAAFEALRACLTAFNVDVDITSVLVSSPGRLDGRTTVATNLARTMALAGRDVILVDADLRRPCVADRFGVAASVGLGGVLGGDLSAESALVAIELASLPAGRLRLLPAERGLPNPSERLAGARMAELMRQLTAIADVVVVDSAPISAVGDALPLVATVSGVVAVARLDATTRDAARALARIVGEAGGTLLGSVATAARTPQGPRPGGSG